VPDAAKAKKYAEWYERYLEIGNFTENILAKH
jgi:hypothetical protein